MGCTPPQVALAWLAARRGNIIPLLGATSVSQLDENLAAAGMHLGDAQLRVLDKASAPSLGFPHDLLQRENVANGTYGDQWRLVDDRRTKHRRPTPPEPRLTPRSSTVWVFEGTRTTGTVAVSRGGRAVPSGGQREGLRLGAQSSPRTTCGRWSPSGPGPGHIAYPQVHAGFHIEERGPLVWVDAVKDDHPFLAGEAVTVIARRLQRHVRTGAGGPAGQGQPPVLEQDPVGDARDLAEGPLGRAVQFGLQLRGRPGGELVRRPQEKVGAARGDAEADSVRAAPWLGRSVVRESANQERRSCWPAGSSARE
jgi:Aldo/keto reductase family